MANTITQQDFEKLRKGDPLADVPPDFPTTHSRFPTVPSDIFNEAIKDAKPYDASPPPPIASRK
jgi:hypothetical protein